MIHGILVRVCHGAVVEDFKLNYLDERDLFAQLKQKFPATVPDGIIRIQGKNFHYITNASHWCAAGYGPSPHIDGYEVRRAPAHFNPEFFEIIHEYEDYDNPVHVVQN